MPSISSGPPSSGSWPCSIAFRTRQTVAVLPIPARPTTVISRFESSFRKSPNSCVSTWRFWK